MSYSPKIQRVEEMLFRRKRIWMRCANDGLPFSHYIGMIGIDFEHSPLLALRGERLAQCDPKWRL